MFIFSNQIHKTICQDIKSLLVHIDIVKTFVTYIYIYKVWLKRNQISIAEATERM